MIGDILGKTFTLYGLDKLSQTIGIDPSIGISFGTPILSRIYTGFQRFLWQPQPGPTLTIDPPINDGTYYDEQTGQDVPMPAEGTPGRAWWDAALSYFRNNFSNFLNDSHWFDYVSHPTISPNPVTIPATEPRIPDGATACDYVDPFTEQAKKGYRIDSGRTSYTIFDRWTGLAVKRVTPNVIEEGEFVYRPIKKTDGSFHMDLQRPSFLNKGQLTYATLEGGEVAFKIAERNVAEIFINGPASDIIMDPNTTQDAWHKIIDGALRIVYLGLDLIVQNGQVKKSTGDSLSSEELQRRLTTSYIFGNGFENEERPEDTSDPLMESYIANLEVNDQIISEPRKFVVYLYELTKIIGNGIDWITDFGYLDARLSSEVRNFLTFIKVGGAPLNNFFSNEDSVNSVPDIGPLRDWFKAWQNWYKNTAGLGNNLVQEVIDELEKLQWGSANSFGRGPLKDSIAFAHSGFAAPLLTAIEQKQYDVETVLIYEGPHPNYYQTFTNPNLKRIIHVQGTGNDWVGSLLEGDSPVPFLGDAHFGGARVGFECLNIHIEGAFHNDFSYNPNDYADRLDWDVYPEKAKRELINRRTNLFMRQLYKRALSDQTSPGSLARYLDSLRITGIASYKNGVWLIDPELLQD